jgi:hypothetical protein
MARGIIKLPLQDGRKELSWYVGRVAVKGTNEVNPVVPLKVERDADFVTKRWWMVQYPSAPGVAQDFGLSLPPQTTITLRDGGTKRGLSLVAGNARTIMPDASSRKAEAAWQGLACPLLIRANNNLFVEVANPAAAGTPWTGDLFIVLEGFKVYPYLPAEFPGTVETYAVPFDLNANADIANPNSAAQYITGQVIKATNNGEGKMLVKGMRLTIIDAAGLDKTDVLMPALAFMVSDSTSGGKKWVVDTNPSVLNPACPASMMLYSGTFLSFNTPRYIDQNGVIETQLVFPSDAATLAAIGGAATWPCKFSLTYFGALLPR